MSVIHWRCYQEWGLHGITENIAPPLCGMCVKYSNNFDLCETNEMQYPNTIIPRIEELPVTQGLQCLYNSCNYACILLRAMEDHCTLCHGWVALKGISPRCIFLTLGRSYVDSVWCANAIQRQHTQVLLGTYVLCLYFADPELDDFLQQALAATDLKDVEEARQKISSYLKYKANGRHLGSIGLDSCPAVFPP